MADRARHAFGSLANVETALAEGKIDSYDILFLDGDTEPKVGWVDSKGEVRIVKAEADLSEVEAELAKKVDAEAVQSMIEEHYELAVEVVEF